MWVVSHLDWQPLGETVLRGISRPVQVHRPLSPRPVLLRSPGPETLGPSPVLIGREREMVTTLDRAQKLREGCGHTVFLT